MARLAEHSITYLGLGDRADFERLRATSLSQRVTFMIAHCMAASLLDCIAGTFYEPAERSDGRLQLLAGPQGPRGEHEDDFAPLGGSRPPGLLMFCILPMM